jgi:hypothetical protein
MKLIQEGEDMTKSRSSMVEPNLKRIRLWMRALLSGKYKQTTNCLRDMRGLCCLGVACEIYRRHTRKGGWGKEGYSGRRAFLSEEDFLPWAVANWYGFNRTNPMLCRRSASNRNDELKNSFKDIAAAVKKEFLVKRKLKKKESGR